MEMLQLRYFYESAMAESISKTAQKFMVPASSVSASIKRLEKEYPDVNKRLFGAMQRGNIDGWGK